MSCSRLDYELSLDAVLRGSRGNLTAAYLSAFDVFDGRLRDAVCGRLSELAVACPLVDDEGINSTSSFDWVDGSRRRRYSYDGTL